MLIITSRILFIMYAPLYTYNTHQLYIDIIRYFIENIVSARVRPCITRA